MKRCAWCGMLFNKRDSISNWYGADYHTDCCVKRLDAARALKEEKENEPLLIIAKTLKALAILEKGKKIAVQRKNDKWYVFIELDGGWWGAGGKLLESVISSVSMHTFFTKRREKK